jgi:hypothetical protein
MGTMNTALLVKVNRRQQRLAQDASQILGRCDAGSNSPVGFV